MDFYGARQMVNDMMVCSEAYDDLGVPLLGLGVVVCSGTAERIVASLSSVSVADVS